MRAWKILIASLTLCFLVVGLTACSAPSNEPAPSDESAQKNLTIGKETTDSFKLTITNDTGSDIVSIATKGSTQTEYGTNLLADGDTWKNGENADIFVVPSRTVTVQHSETETDTTSEETTAVEFVDTVDFEFKLANGSVYAIHQISAEGLSRAQEVTLTIDAPSGLAYLIVIVDGDVASTIEAEKEIKAQAENPVVEAPPAAAAEEPESSTEYYGEVVDPGYSYSNDYSYSSGDSGVGQSEDRCADVAFGQ